MTQCMEFEFSIDRGGTFTDIFCQKFSKSQTNSSPVEEETLKLLSVDPNGAYSDAPCEGIRRILSRNGVPTSLNGKIPANLIKSIRMGTTVATNALLERNGNPCVLVITKGFKDLLFIGNQARPAIFDLNIKTPTVLYDKVLEVDERIVVHPIASEVIDYAFTGQRIGELLQNYLKSCVVLTKIDESRINRMFSDLYNEIGSDVSIAICFLHAHIYPNHEMIAERAAKAVGFKHVYRSSKVIPMVKAVPRGQSTTADAYLNPLIMKYLSGFYSHFEGTLPSVNFMKSDGGLVDASQFHGLPAILSGPAGGYVGFSKATARKFPGMPVLGFDMGGTSTDVSRYSGSFDHVYETVTAGIALQTPQLNIKTVAAGGGSCLDFQEGLFVVGPKSAGAFPGPCCYGRDGPLTITDANVMLGRLAPRDFPHIFGPNEDQPLQVKETRKKFALLYDAVCKEKEMSFDEMIQGFVDVANESMCRPIRAITESKGFSPANHILCCFGGAGGQHACAIARNLGITCIYIHRHSSILSAYGLSLAEISAEHQEPCNVKLSPENWNKIVDQLGKVVKKSSMKLTDEQENLNFNVVAYLNMRFSGTDTSMMIESENYPALLELDYFKGTFVNRYKQEFGFTLHDRSIIVDDVRARCTSCKEDPSILTEDDSFDTDFSNYREVPAPEYMQSAYFKIVGRLDIPVYKFNSIKGSKVKGPALIIDSESTIIVEPEFIALVDREGSVCLKLAEERNVSSILVGSSPNEIDPIQVTLFSHRFMSIAEQMGHVLAKTSVSTNIKERLDFSCALFCGDGNLVANAPHIPVHLGSMQEAVKYQLQNYEISEGDVILTNHPDAGGSHLPDMTVITPVFHEGVIIFFVASRGHHADIGGITPGSMPPQSHYLAEEGAAILSLKIVTKDSGFNETALRKVLADSRNLKDNISDFKAQISANQRGISLCLELVMEHGLDRVIQYMKNVQKSAERAVRSMLRRKCKELGKCVLHSSDFMDDGSKIDLNVTIEPNEGSAVFDFTGSSAQVWGNTNTPYSITHSAVIYCLRCMMSEEAPEIPLNQGCLCPIQIKLRPGSILKPDSGMAVVGGNVLTSQRIVDVILMAFEAAANSQGCMNNVTFGKNYADGENRSSSFGYYETICGGSGAGPKWAGRDAVHTHMTNTRLTDIEVLEQRHPELIIKSFEINRDNDDENDVNDNDVKDNVGGRGVKRLYEFRESLNFSILSERRCFPPKGCRGGRNGTKGLNLWHRLDSSPSSVPCYQTINLGSKASITVKKGDQVLIKTPGGGSFNLGH